MRVSERARESAEFDVFYAGTATRVVRQLALSPETCPRRKT